MRPRSVTPALVYGGLVAALVVPANLYAAALGADARALDAAPPLAQAALYAQALIPAVAALGAWAVARERPTWGFRRTTRASLGSAWAIGVAAAALPYLVGWATGVAPFSASRLSAATSGLPAATAVLIGLAPAVLGYAVLAIGEELGWNSFLAVRLLRRRGPDATALILGPVWALFHLPLMLVVPGAVASGVPLGWAVVLFTGQCMALAFVAVGLRHRTGSIWPVLLLHGAFNAVLYTITEPATDPTAAGGWLLGEGGLLTTLGTVAVVVATRSLWRTATPTPVDPRTRRTEPGLAR